jgi:hypothetical protein
MSTLPHNQIVLYTSSGKRVSIIQNYENDPEGLARGTHGETVEIMIGSYEPHYNVTLERLADLLQGL